MVGSLSLGKFLLMIFETAGSFSPTACAMSFSLRLLENGAELVPSVTGNSKGGGYVFVGATNMGESPSSRGAFFILALDRYGTAGSMPRRDGSIFSRIRLRHRQTVRSVIPSSLPTI